MIREGRSLLETCHGELSSVQWTSGVKLIKIETSSFSRFEISVTVDVVLDPPVRTIVDEST